MRPTARPGWRAMGAALEAAGTGAGGYRLGFALLAGALALGMAGYRFLPR